MNDPLGEAAALARAGRHREAAEALEAAAASTEHPDEAVCSRAAAAWAGAGDGDRALRWAVRTVDAGTSFTRWRAASRVLDDVRPGGAPDQRRQMKVAVLATSNATALLPCLRLALARIGVGATLHEAAYGQYWQEALQPSETLRGFDPDVVVLVPDHHSVDDALEVDDAEGWLAAELARWRAPWDALRRWTSADIVQVGMVSPPNDPLGSAGATMPSSRRSRLRALDGALARAAASTGVSFVDADALASEVGKRTWFDDRYWHAAKHAFSMQVAPELGLRISAVIAARAGLGKKVVVVDLDNTLWHGVIGDDGLSGIELAGPRGEAHVAFQRALADLVRRGVLLAACSKNDDATARLPFERHPDMVLELEDFAAFTANWEPKPQNLERMSRQLGLGLDSFLYVDDNPAEREAIRRALPMVDVLRLSADEADWCQDLARYPWLEPAGLTDEDRHRAASYRARSAARTLELQGESLEDFQRSLAMTATLAPIDDLAFDRVVQLLHKTNQFNVTTRRHPPDAVRRMMEDGSWIHLTARLSDRFADHGLVAVALARAEGDVLDVDTLLMSCRVIGRGLETVLIEELSAAARARDLRTVRGHYVPTDRNGLVASLWADHGFAETGGGDDGSRSFEREATAEPTTEPPITIVRKP